MLPQLRRPLTTGCCHAGGPQASTQSPTPSQAPTPRQSRTGWDIATGALSVGVWVLMPKCPVCLAAHVALWTGLGLSFTTATYLRWSLLVASGLLLLYVIVKRKVRAWSGPVLRRID